MYDVDTQFHNVDVKVQNFMMLCLHIVIPVLKLEFWIIQLSSETLFVARQIWLFSCLTKSQIKWKLICGGNFLVFLFSFSVLYW